MRITSFLGAAALITVSTAAAAAPAPANRAAPLSVARAASPAAKSSKIGASVPSATLINIGILAALTAGVLLLTGGDDSDSN